MFKQNKTKQKTRSVNSATVTQSHTARAQWMWSEVENSAVAYWAVQWSWFAWVNALCNLSRKKSREVVTSLPGRFLSRHCFTLCIRMEVEHRIAFIYINKHVCMCTYTFTEQFLLNLSSPLLLNWCLKVAKKIKNVPSILINLNQCAFWINDISDK